MKSNNLIDIRSWKVECDNIGSRYVILDDKIISVELTKAEQINGGHTYCNIMIFLNHSFNKKRFEIPKCKGFELTYKNTSDKPIVFNIEENDEKYFYYILPSSKEWITKIVNIGDMRNSDDEKRIIKLGNIKAFRFSINSNEKDQVVDQVSIKKMIINGYEVVTLKNGGYQNTNIFLERSMFNELRVFLFNRKEKNSIIDPNGRLVYCLYPFLQERINRDYVTVCCDIYTNVNVDLKKNRTIRDIWYGEEFERIREGIRDQSYSECDLKRCIQYTTTRESFKNMNDIKKMFPKIADYLSGKNKKYAGMPEFIVAGFDGRCNLKCRSCTAHDKKISKTDFDKYVGQIEKYGVEVEKLSIAGFGDPFGSPFYREWLYNFNPKKYPKLKTIEIMTNAILWTPENWDKIYHNFKGNNINFETIISIDGATKETYEYNRGNARFGDLLKNLDFIRELKKQNIVKSIYLCFVVQMNNYIELPLMVDLAERFFCDRIYFNPITNWGSYTNEDFILINIFNEKHPEHERFKKICYEVKKCPNNKTEIYFGFKL